MTAAVLTDPEKSLLSAKKNKSKHQAVSLRLKEAYLGMVIYTAFPFIFTESYEWRVEAQPAIAYSHRRTRESLYFYIDVVQRLFLVSIRIPVG